MDQVESYKDKIFKNAKEKGLSMNLVNYVWEQVIAPQVGYSFNLAHTFSYSIVALQEMNLAYNYPIVFWNTANLIVDAGAEYESDEEYENEESDFIFEDDEDLVAAMKVDYGKIASAIGTMQQAGIKVSAPNINTSGLTFTPDPEKEEIYYGLSGITRVGGDVVDEILTNRPYESFADFRSKVSLNITQLVSLIKADAFSEFGEMRKLMREVLEEKADKKTRLNLQNANMLFLHNLIPEEFNFNERVFYFNKYIKGRQFWDKSTGTLLLNQTAFRFYADHFSLDDVEPSGSDFIIKEKTWKVKYYDKYMLPVKNYIAENEQELLTQLNEMLYGEVLDKYAQGTDAKWSMDALSFYRGEHELDALNNNAYGIQDFFELPREPQIDYSFTTKDGNEINMMKLTKIAGTVIDKDKGKQQVVLLTTSGVVIVKAYGTFAHYDKQISKVIGDGKKVILQRSMFSRGNKLVVNGMRRGDQFIAKKYKNSTVPHTFMQIGDIDEKGFITYIERLEQDGE